MILVTVLVALICIFGQAARGVASHCNTASFADERVFALSH